MNTNRAPFTTAELMQLPRNAYAFRNRFGVWGIRQDTDKVETVVRNANNMPLVASDYYATPVDALVVAEIVSRSFTVAQHIDKAYNG
jgi:hypothetical protein